MEFSVLLTFFNFLIIQFYIASISIENKRRRGIKKVCTWKINFIKTKMFAVYPGHCSSRNDQWSLSCSLLLYQQRNDVLALTYCLLGALLHKLACLCPNDPFPWTCWCCWKEDHKRGRQQRRTTTSSIGKIVDYCKWFRNRKNEKISSKITFLRISSWSSLKSFSILCF